MKRNVFTILLFLLLCSVLLASCKEGSVSPTAATTETAENEEIATVIEVVTKPFDVPGDITYISGEVIDVISEEEIVVKLDDKYTDVFGSSVGVIVDNTTDYTIKLNDAIRVVIDSATVKEGIKIVARNYQITKVAIDSDSIKTGTGIIPALNEIKIADYIPDISTTDTWVCDNTDYKIRYLRVAQITDDKVYLVNSFDKTAKFVIRGVPDATFYVGGHVSFDISKYYYYNDKAVGHLIPELFLIEDMSGFSSHTVEEVVNHYKKTSGGTNFAKPVIYLYPEADIECSVKISFDGELTCTYPEHGENGWESFVAKPDGTLVFPNGREYYCLYWEGEGDLDADYSKGFCVKGSETAEFLNTVLLEMGLTPREANEFIIYWLPMLKNNPYNLITFQNEAYTSVAELEINPTPDSVLRVYMVAKPIDNCVDIEPQEFEPFERKGFTVVEWGGTIDD